MSNVRSMPNRRRNGRPPGPPEPPVIAGRAPRHDLDCEGAVLSAILLERDALDRVHEILKDGEAFYSDSNRRIYEAALDLTRQGRPVDIVSVAAWLREKNWMGQIGGPSYLAQLADATPAVAHVSAHAQVVWELWRLRCLCATCQRISAECYGDVGPIQEFIDTAEGAIYDLARNESRTESEPLKTSLARVFRMQTERAAGGRKLAGVPTGYVDLDRKLGGLQQGDFIVVPGRPGHGKSSLALNMAIGVATPRMLDLSDPEQPYRKIQVPDTVTGVQIFSLEMPTDQLSLRALCAEARVDIERARLCELQPADWSRMAEAAPSLSALPIFIDDTPGLALLDIRARVRRKQAEFDKPATEAQPEQRIAACVLDYFQLLRSDEPANNRDDELGKISRGLKRLAKELRICVIAISSMNRAVEQRAGKSKKPQLSDIRECGSLEFDADTVMFVHRPELVDEKDRPGIAEIIIPKNRNGSVGTVLMRFDAKSTRFDSLAPGEAPEGYDE